MCPTYTERQQWHNCNSKGAVESHYFDGDFRRHDRPLLATGGFEN